ncbi:MAG TPA: Flp family type IVb pilin [Candidatus Baltobacteraceae bacterium]|nr:Flp family type IVb pilin [Candidatus Baltobacteraceae bacterium]
MLNQTIAMLTDDEGATMVEYGVIVALIAAVCIAVVALIGGNVNAAFTSVNSKL